MIGWSQDQFACASGVAKATIANFELGKRAPYATTLASMRETFILAGVDFIHENGGGVGVRLRERKGKST